MRRILVTAAMGAALMLAACSTTSSSTMTPQKAAEEVMTSAEATFNVAAQAEVDAKASGLLTGAKATQADGIKAQAYAALKAMRVIYQQGQTPDPTQLLALTNDLLAAAGQPTVATATPSK